MVRCSHPDCINEGNFAVVVNGPPIGKPAIYLAYQIEADGFWCDQHIEAVNPDDVLSEKLRAMAVRDAPADLGAPDFSRVRLIPVAIDAPDYKSLIRKREAKDPLGKV